MSNISIKSTSISKKDSASNIGNSEFFKLKKEYEKQKRKMQKTDFANSPVALEKELTLLTKLKELAEKEGLSEEVKSILDREQSIYTKLANNHLNSDSGFYYPQVAFKGSKSKEFNLSPNNGFTRGYSLEFLEDIDEQEFVNMFKSLYPDIMLDENAEAIIKILGSKNFGASNAAYIIKKCMDDKGHISVDKLCTIKLLTDAEMTSAVIPQILEEFAFFDEKSQQEKIDLDSCKKICDFKYLGFSDIDSLHLTRYLNSNLSDSDSVVKNILRMNKSGISSDAILRIFDALRTYDVETGKDNISNSSVQSVIRIKKALILARNNEKTERNNPINLLGIQKFSFGNDIMIVKDGEIKCISPVEGESVFSLQQQYDEMISKIEDNLLINFVNKYKDKNGEIDSKYVRTLIALRHYGITYGPLLNMIDMCINKNGRIDKNTLETIEALKKSGALSEDITLILSSIKKDSDELYNQADINNASILTSQVIPGQIVVALLPDIAKDENLKDFVIDFSSLMEDKKYLIDLVNLVKDDKGNIDENAMDVIYNLAQNILDKDNSINMKEFLGQAARILNSVKNDGDDNVNDEGAGIVALMCQNSQSIDDIVAVLDACHDSKGCIDKKLSELTWKMSLQKADSNQILKLIVSCKKEENINYNLIDTIISFFNSNVPIEKILKFALN